MRLSAIFTLIAGFTIMPAAAQQNAQDIGASEELSGQMLGDINALVGQITQKLNSSKPMTPGDFDSVFNDKFFSGEGDPFAKLEQLEKKMNEQPGPEKARFGDSYRKWSSERLDAKDLEPETREEAGGIVMDFKVPPGAGSSLDLNINKSRIKMKYASKDVRELKRADGTTYTTSFLKRHEKIISIPRGADPAGYKTERTGQGVRITFQKKTGRNKAGASK